MGFDRDLEALESARLADATTNGIAVTAGGGTNLAIDRQDALCGNLGMFHAAWPSWHALELMPKEPEA
ncbi:MAG: hypothetical protein ABIT04_11970 [Novosphingobium sp.]